MATALSEMLLRDLRVVDARSAVIEFGRGAGANFAASARAMLHLVLQGSINLWGPKSAGPLLLHAGDCAILFYGDQHALRDVAQPPAADTVLQIWSPLDEAPPTIVLGHAPANTAVLSSALELGYVSPAAFANRAGPDCWVQRRYPDDVAQSRALALDLDEVRQGFDGPGAAAFATALSALLLVHMVRAQYEQVWHDQSVALLAPNTRRVAAALRGIHAHPDRDWTVARLAQEVGLSRSAFAETFRDAVGATPLAYITNLRMQRAAQLLADERITSREVAERVGYRLESSFARAFKKHHSLSPQKFAAARHR